MTSCVYCTYGIEMLPIRGSLFSTGLLSAFLVVRQTTAYTPFIPGHWSKIVGATQQRALYTASTMRRGGGIG